MYCVTRAAARLSCVAVIRLLLSHISNAAPSSTRYLGWALSVRFGSPGCPITGQLPESAAGSRPRTAQTFSSRTDLSLWQPLR